MLSSLSVTWSMSCSARSSCRSAHRVGARRGPWMRSYNERAVGIGSSTWSFKRSWHRCSLRHDPTPTVMSNVPRPSPLPTLVLVRGTTLAPTLSPPTWRLFPFLGTSVARLFIAYVWTGRVHRTNTPSIRPRHVLWLYTDHLPERGAPVLLSAKLI